MSLKHHFVSKLLILTWRLHGIEAPFLQTTSVLWQKNACFLLRAALRTGMRVLVGYAKHLWETSPPEGFSCKLRFTSLLCVKKISSILRFSWNRSKLHDTFKNNRYLSFQKSPVYSGPLLYQLLKWRFINRVFLHTAAYNNNNLDVTSSDEK